MCSICIESIFRGPPTSGNGGYVAGVFAKHLAGDVEVKLMLPPPLNKQLNITVEGQAATLFDEDKIVAQAANIEFPSITIPKPPTFAEAKVVSEQSAANKTSNGYQLTQKIDCFVCSLKRKQGDGLRIFAGVLGRDNLVAAPWYPYAALADDKGNIKSEFVWAALDCPGVFSAYEYFNAPFLLLGKQAVHIKHTLSVDQNYIACGWHVKKEGRKHFTNTALFDEAGKLYAYATQIWIEVKNQ